MSRIRSALKRESSVPRIRNPPSGAAAPTFPIGSASAFPSASFPWTGPPAVPMALPSFGGMLFVLITIFVVPCCYCMFKEMEFNYMQKKEDKTK